jgi:hypothetical protein
MREHSRSRSVSLRSQRLSARLRHSPSAAVIATRPFAQTVDIVANGNAVTGFYGARPPTAIEPSTDPTGETFIDLQGPAACVFDLQTLGAPPQAQLTTAPKRFAVIAGQVRPVRPVTTQWRAVKQ